MTGRVPVFCYHEVSSTDLEADLKYLTENGYTTIDTDTLLGHLEGSLSIPERAVVLSFDDGPRNHYDVVFPLLRRYRMTAVAFIAPRFHGEDAGTSRDMAYDRNTLPLSWTQIREMHESGYVDFQSHTYEHRYIPRWPETVKLAGSDPSAVETLRGPVITVAEDLRLAKEILEQRLGKTIQHLAFPKFDGTAEAVRIALDLGYKSCWWGVLPHRPDNRAGQVSSHIVRVDARYVRRLPGKGRVALGDVLLRRYAGSVRRVWCQFVG
jgi:peptidoglycan/xylan/chitin deacetylase (PgdA/CDA1 family)